MSDNLLNSSAPLYYEDFIRLDMEIGFCYNYCVKSTNEITLHTHNYYEIFFLPYEGCNHIANGTMRTLEPGTLIFIRPDDCHDFINAELKNINIHQLAVRQVILDNLFVFLGEHCPSKQFISSDEPPIVVLEPLQRKELLKVFEDLNTIPFENPNKRALAMRQLLTMIFTEYFSEDSVFISKNSIKAPRWLSKAYSAMKEKENFALGIDRMTELSGFSKEYLCRNMKKYYNCTPNEYITELRLTYIANKLIYTEEPIQDICYSSGYNNLSWMYSLFKKKYGMSPVRFRKENTKGSDII